MLQQLLHSESLHVRVKKGAGPAVNLLTPWNWPDKKKLPRVPVWTVESNKENERERDRDRDRDDDNDDDESRDKDKDKEKEKEKKREKERIKEREREREREREGMFPDFAPTIDELIDLSGSR